MTALDANDNKRSSQVKLRRGHRCRDVVAVGLVDFRPARCYGPRFFGIKSTMWCETGYVCARHGLIASYACVLAPVTVDAPGSCIAHPRPSAASTERGLYEREHHIIAALASHNGKQCRYFLHISITFHISMQHKVYLGRGMIGDSKG